MEQIHSTNRLSRGWQMMVSSWRVLKLDKELATLPIWSGVASLISLIPLAVAATALVAFAGKNNITGLVIGFAVYLVMTLIVNFFAGALIFGATQRFRGEDPTVKSSLAGAWKKRGPLALFGLLSATIGFAVRIAEERLPLLGDIAARIVGGAWSIATVFAVPVIVLSDENIGPFVATKRSVGVIKQIWGEGIVANIGIGLVSFLAISSYAVLVFAVATIPFFLPGSGASQAGFTVTGFVVLPFILLALTGFGVLIAVLTALNSIAKAALYHYAITGVAPETFNSDLLRASMTQKKARRLFA